MPALRAPFYGFLALTCLWLLFHPVPEPPQLKGASPALCPPPAALVELRGLGVTCLPAAVALQRGVAAGAVLPVSEAGELAAGPPGRLQAERWLVAQVPLDANQATLEELVALPDIGPALAQRIIAARPLRALADLARVPGVGARRLARLEGLLQVVTPPP